MLEGTDVRILSYYRERDIANFTELCRHAGTPSDLGAYYINRLVRRGYLQKLSRGTYQVTVTGKKQLIDLTAKPHFPKPNRIRIILLFVGTQAGKYICLRRDVQPYLRRLEWPAGEVFTGENMSDAAKRLFEERIGASCPMHFRGFFRRLDTFKGEIFDDKIFAVHTYKLAPGFVLMRHSPRGKLVLLSLEEVQSQEKLSRSLVDILHYTKSRKDSGMQENIYELDDSDLYVR